MGIMRWVLFNRLKEIYDDVSLTYGYKTKNKRIENNLPKEHKVDAYCIANNLNARLSDTSFYFKKVRCHNRQIHRMNYLKGGIKKNNQASYTVKGFRLFDKVKYQNKEYFIFGRRGSGHFDIRDLSWNKVNKGSISCKKLEFIEPRKNVLIERRIAGN